jgi:hypothetical protein
LREFILENDKLVALKDEVYNTVSQALKELLLPEQFLRIWLKILSRKCTFTKAQRAELLRAFYRKQIAIPVSIKKAENWLLSWEAIMAKIIKHKISKNDHDFWRNDFITIWNDHLLIAFNNLRQRWLQTADLAPEDYTREIREVLQLQHANKKLRRAIRTTAFIAEFNGHPPPDSPSQIEENQRGGGHSRKRGASEESQFSNPARPRNKKKKITDDRPTCEGCKGPYMLQACNLVANPDDPVVGDYKKRMFNHKFERNSNFASKVRQLRKQRKSLY